MQESNSCVDVIINIYFLLLERSIFIHILTMPRPEGTSSTQQHVVPIYHAD